MENRFIYYKPTERKISTGLVAGGIGWNKPLYISGNYDAKETYFDYGNTSNVLKGQMKMLSNSLIEHRISTAFKTHFPRNN